MFHKESHQSQSLSEVQITGSQVQMSQAAKDSIQNQKNNQNTDTEEAKTVSEIFDSVSKIKILIQNSALNEECKNKALSYLSVVKEEIEQKEPDKAFAAKNLKRMCDTIKTVNETLEQSKGLLEKLQPLLIPLVSWLGVAKSLLGF